MPARGKTFFIAFSTILCSATYSQQTDKLTIYFDFNSFQMTNESSRRIDSFLYTKKNIPITKIALKGHCDKIGTNVYNDKLALRRVATTKQYLLNMGFENSKITSM